MYGLCCCCGRRPLTVVNDLRTSLRLATDRSARPGANRVSSTAACSHCTIGQIHCSTSELNRRQACVARPASRCAQSASAAAVDIEQQALHSEGTTGCQTTGQQPSGTAQSAALPRRSLPRLAAHLRACCCTVASCCRKRLSDCRHLVAGKSNLKVKTFYRRR